MKMELSECSETSAHKIQMLGSDQKERIQHSEHGESLKSSFIIIVVIIIVIVIIIVTKRIPYQGSSGRVWRLQNRRTNHSHCEICR